MFQSFTKYSKLEYYYLIIWKITNNSQTICIFDTKQK